MTSSNGQMHNDIMAAGFKERLPMLAPVLADGDNPVEAVHMILNGIGNDIYSIVYACPNAKEMWISIERLQQGESINIQDVKTKLFWKFDTMQQHQYEVNEIQAERRSRNANLLALVAATQHYPDNYPQVPKPYKTQAPSSKQTTSNRSHATTRNKDIEKSEKIQSNDDYNVFATEREQSEQPESINDTYVVEKLKKAIMSLTQELDKGKLDLWNCKIKLESLVNLDYLKKTQWEKPCLYNVKYDKNDLANLFAPESEETIHLEEESRSKLEYLLTNAFISKSKQAFKVVQGNIDNIRAVVELKWKNDLLYVVLLSFDDIDEYSEMACKYLGKIEKCERLEAEVPKSHKQKHDKNFAQLEQHYINHELALQHAKEKNVCENSWERQLLKSGNNEKVWKAQNYSLIAEPPPK
ncbi:hypothetical protein Tco_0188715 [Tanacetum coccineum]